MTKNATESLTKGVATRIDLDLYRKVKVAAVMQDKRISYVVEDALRLWLTTVTSDGTPAGA